MDEKKKKKMMMMVGMIMMLTMGMVVGQGGSGTSATNPVPFLNCYTRCMFFCMIEPQNACTCTSTCLKKCLDTPTTMAKDVDEHTQNLGYCKLGCATSLCSNISNPHDPDGKSMGKCVDSCSNKCNMSY
ncbi:hypothetical protein R6Q57_000140 [Mikania cordata]